MVYQATKEIAQALEKRDIKYNVRETEKSSIIDVSYNAENANSIEILLSSSDDDNDVSVRSYRIVKVPEDKKTAVVLALNELNAKYRYIKFVLDDDGDVNAEYDLPVRGSNVGEVGHEMISRFVNIIDEAYPVIMRALWS